MNRAVAVVVAACCCLLIDVVASENWLKVKNSQTTLANNKALEEATRENENSKRNVAKAHCCALHFLRCQYPVMTISEWKER